MPKNDKKKNALGTIASIQTILERYPVLIDNDTMGNTSLSFTFDLLEILGISPDDILDWLSKLLSREGGWLTALEASIKALLITTFKDTYTCSINPRLPVDAMLSVSHRESSPIGTGVKVNIDDIDAFGILNNCPTTEKGSVFYFDSHPDDGYNTLNVYSSTDFNAYLWYIINRGQDPPTKRSIWDNRNDYRKKFEKNATLKETFFSDSYTANVGNRAPFIKVPGVGVKKEILACSFTESGTGIDSNYVKVFINSDRYLTSLGARTVFEFNFDYITSLKLFDSKTLVAQIINAVAGISTSLNVNLSLNKQIIAAKIEEVVEKVIETDDIEPEDCYFTFSNQEYDRLVNKAIERYKGKADELSEVIVPEVTKISNASKGEESGVIKEVFKTVSKEVASYNYPSEKKTEWLGKDIIRKFLKETVLQITLQVLSPKVMLLYAINEKVLEPNGERTIGVEKFFEKFVNLLVSLVKQIFNLLMEYLAEFIISQLKQILIIFIEKLMLERIASYMLLIEQLISTCTVGIGNLSLSFNGRRNNPISIENVQGADIIPSKDTPVVKEC